MMRHNIKTELRESMDSLHFSDASKSHMMYRLVNQKSEEKHPIQIRRAVFLAAAAVMLIGLLTGAAAFTRWSQTAQEKYSPTQEIKEQAQQSGLSVMLNETSGEVLSAENQGITITAVQTIVDQHQAEIIFRVEGFQIPEGRYPALWPEITLDGSRDFYSVMSNDFRMDGDAFEYIQYITFQDEASKYFGKEITAYFDAVSLQSEDPAGLPETAVIGNWKLRWTFTGTEEAIRLTPNTEISDSGIVLLEASVGQKTIRTTYRLESYWAGWETLETFQPRLRGIRMQDGTEISCYASTEGYQDMDNLIYFVESSMDGILDLSQIESLVFVMDDTSAIEYIPVA